MPETTDTSILNIDDGGKADGTTASPGLTREEQAEREKDAFAPGGWVVCVRADHPASVGDILQCQSPPFEPVNFFAASVGTAHRRGFRKHRFRPATSEEIKARETKLTLDTAHFCKQTPLGGKF